MPVAQNEQRNRLLSLMSADDYASLIPHLDRGDFQRGYVLAVAGEQIE